MVITVDRTARHAAELMRGIASHIATRAGVRLPNLRDSFNCRGVVVLANSDAEALGWFQGGHWTVGGERLDQIVLNTGHPSLRHCARRDWATSLLATLAHELAHLHAHASGLPDTCGIEHVEHTRAFASIAVRMGLRVEQHPTHPARYVTPGFTPAGRFEVNDLATRVERSLLVPQRPGEQWVAFPPHLHAMHPDLPTVMWESSAAPSLRSSRLRFRVRRNQKGNHS